MPTIDQRKTGQPKTGQPKTDLEPAARRLLEALAQPGAYGSAQEGFGRPEIAIAAPRKGVSVRIHGAAPATAAELCSRGLAAWEDDSRAVRRLRVTQAGQARLARAAAPAGAEPFLAQHTTLAPGRVEGVPVSALLDAGESPLAWLATRRGRDGHALVDAACLAAGERLRRDLTLAQMLPRVTANWSANVAAGARGPDATTYSDAVIAARQRAGAALSAVGPDFAGLLMDVCGFLKGLELVERERQWPQRSAKVVLVLALRELCRHYGLASQASGPDRARGVRHWGSSDFRPAIGPVEPG